MLNTLTDRLRNRRPAPPAPAPRPLTYKMYSDWAAIDLAGMDVLTWTPAALSPAERLLLYTLTFTLRPARYLEIGTLHGGSALVVHAAMDATGGPGRMVCVDLEMRIAPEHRSRLENRATLLEGRSPEILAAAREAAGGSFELAFIDGDHTYRGALTDARAVLPLMAGPLSYMVFHDSFNPEVGRAVDEFVASSEGVTDCAILTRDVSLIGEPPEAQTPWGGMRVIQVLSRS